MSGPRVSLVTLGCARNDVDSSELAGRLALGGYTLLEERDPEPPDVIVVNTCAFVDAAKKDSIDTLLAAADTGAKVVAVGCLAERYGDELAAALPEADAVLGFDAYPDLPGLLGEVLHGRRPAAHHPIDRRTLLPISPADRPAAADGIVVPGHGRADVGPDPSRPAPGAAPAMLATGAAPAMLATGAVPAGLATGTAPAGLAAGPAILRRLLRAGPVAPLKIASGCDRRCTFCAIPSFRGSFVSRGAPEILAEARWLADQHVREVVLVSENSTSYGKDLPGSDHLEDLLAALAATPGLARIRLTYLQPAETRPSLIAAIASTPGVADYFDMSFQHASAPVLRRMRRFGSRESFLALVDQIRAAAPEAGIRTNVIVGFPGESEDDLAELEAFLVGARLDAVGVFGYSDEDGTAAAGLTGKLDPDVVAERVERITRLAEEIAAQRAEDRVGTVLTVLVDETDELGVWARGEHQAPEVDGATRLLESDGIAPGTVLRVEVVSSDGIDLVARPLDVLEPVVP